MTEGPGEGMFRAIAEQAMKLSDLDDEHALLVR